MTTHDIHLHHDHQVAVYSITAMEFVSGQIFKQTATNYDVISVIEFNSEKLFFLIVARLLIRLVQ